MTSIGYSRRLLAFAAVAFFSVSGAVAQGWITTLGGSKEDIVHDMISTSDGGSVLTGYTMSNDGDFAGMNRGAKDVFVFKLSPSGELAWKKMFGGSADDVANAIAPTSDGGFIVVGHSFSNDGDLQGVNLGQSDILVVKVSAQGAVQWSKVYGGSGEESANCLVVQDNGDVVIAGYTTSNDSDFGWMNRGERDVFVLKINSRGELLWTKTFGGRDTEIATRIVSSAQGSVVVTGYTSSEDGDFANINKGIVGVFAIKLDAGGRASK
jgi:hypothetical protein